MQQKASRGREKKRAEVKQRLLDAAARIVGDEGYSSSSIARITSMAGVAHGTFYNYFPSQQDLFDELLPNLGDRLLREIRQATGPENDFWLREEIGFRTFFRFVQTYPQFYRILNEAETFATRGYQQHIANMVGRYIRAVRRGIAVGTLRAMNESEIEAVVYTLLAARNYLCMRYALTGPLPEFVTDTYMQLIRHGLAADVQEADCAARQIRVTEVHPNQLDLVWNVRRVEESGADIHYEGALARSLKSGDVATLAQLVADFANHMLLTDAPIRISSVTLVPGTIEAKPFSIVRARVSNLGNGTWSLQMSSSTAEGSAFHASCIVYGTPAEPQ